MTVYISGGITNIPDFKERFKKAEKHLRGLGFNVINPAALQGNVMIGEFKNGEYMDICVPLLSLSDCIYLLDGWQESEGAKREVRQSRVFGLSIVTQRAEKEKGEAVWAQFG